MLTKNVNACNEKLADKLFWAMSVTQNMTETRRNVADKKRIKFRELAEKRTNKALESIRLIGNLSNRQTYAFEDAEVRKIIKTLKDAVSDIEARFEKSDRNRGEFKL